MKYVYILQSLAHPKDSHIPAKGYVGLTADVQSRLRAHNGGESPHTAKFNPWDLVAYFAFRDAQGAVAFEKYLKTRSGRAFAKKHFW